MADAAAQSCCCCNVLQSGASLHLFQALAAWAPSRTAVAQTDRACASPAPPAASQWACGAPALARGDRCERGCWWHAAIQPVSPPAPAILTGSWPAGNEEGLITAGGAATTARGPGGRRRRQQAAHHEPLHSRPEWPMRPQALQQAVTVARTMRAACKALPPPGGACQRVRRCGRSRLRPWLLLQIAARPRRPAALSLTAPRSLPLPVCSLPLFSVTFAALGSRYKRPQACPRAHVASGRPGQQVQRSPVATAARVSRLSRPVH